MTAVTAYRVGMDIRGSLTGAGIALGLVAAVWSGAALANAEPDTAPVVVEEPVEVVKVAPPEPVVAPEPAPVVVPEVVVPEPEPVVEQPAPEPTAPEPVAEPVVEEPSAPAPVVTNPDENLERPAPPRSDIPVGTPENPHPRPIIEGSDAGGYGAP